MRYLTKLTLITFAFLLLYSSLLGQGAYYGCFPQGHSSTNTLSGGFSYNGFQHSPSGDLHILIVIVRYTNQSLASWGNWPDNDTLPVFARNTVPGVNQLFNESPGTISATNAVQNLSEYFYIMSGGKFRVSADIYPVQVPVTFQFTGALEQSDWALMNKEAMEWITQDQINQGNSPDAFWAQYDNRTNTPDFQYDNSNSQPDSILDYLVFIHRDRGVQAGRIIHLLPTPTSSPLPAIC